MFGARTINMPFLRPGSSIVLIRPAVSADAYGLAQVHVASWRGAYRSIMPDAALEALSLEVFAARWTQILAQPQRANFLVEAHDQVVGFASIGPSRDGGAVPLRSAELYALYLHPNVWGRGVGYALWNVALQELRVAEYADVKLWVLEANARARSFYERIGFQLEPGATRALEREGAVLPEVRYCRPLLAPGAELGAAADVPPST